MNTAKDSREFDLVVWGATGFTGALVAEYLAGRYGTGNELRWAIAGRTEAKLQSLRASLGAPAAELAILTADSHDAESLAGLAARTRVVLSTVGPYAIHGSPLVAACVNAGTDYCDLAGETPWIRQMIDSHHERATGTGARIVHCCGFDSVPMDIGAWFLQQEAKQRHGHYCERIALYVKATSGGLSGGTLASMANIVATARKDRAVARVLVDPYALNPPGERDGPDGPDQQGVVYDTDANAWTAPFLMAGINTRVVRRSHALAGFPWGREFRYRETTLTGRGIAGRAKGLGLTGTLGALAFGMSVPPIRKILQSTVLPEPGDGPDRDAREAGFFNLMQIGRLPDGTRLRTRITGDRDPGYGSTSRMISECAVCLARGEASSGGGVLTPAAAMAEPLLARLRQNAGLTFDVLD